MANTAIAVGQQIAQQVNEATRGGGDGSETSAAASSLAAVSPVSSLVRAVEAAAVGVAPPPAVAANYPFIGVNATLMDAAAAAAAAAAAVDSGSSDASGAAPAVHVDIDPSDEGRGAEATLEAVWEQCSLWLEAAKSHGANVYQRALHLSSGDISAAPFGQAAEDLALGALLLSVLLSLLYLVYYFCSAARRPRLYTQHASGGPRARATQRPPVPIDVTLLPSLQGVAHAVSPSSRLGRLLSRRYLPVPWLTFPKLSGHLQTIFTAQASTRTLRTPLITYKRELLSVAAGSPNTLAGVVALDWAVLGKQRTAPRRAPAQEWQSKFTDATPTVILCHGLAGGSTEHYVKNVIFTLSQAPFNYRCVVMNARGCGGSQLVSAQFYCGAYTDDLRQAVANIRSRLPRAPLLGVGFSLGANILTKFVGEEGLAGRPPPFHAVTALANPFDFLHGARHLDSNMVQQMIYSRNLAKNLIRLFKHHTHVLEGDKKRVQAVEVAAAGARARGDTTPEPTPRRSALDIAALDRQADLPPISPAHRESWDLTSVFQAPTLREFDKRLTRIAFGYATVDDYYRDASSARFVKFIATPTLFVNALDDPISDRAAIPYDECCINPFVTLVTTPTGGHSMDWYTGLWRTQSWATRAIAAFLSDVLSVHGADPAHVAAAQHIATPPPPPSTTQEEEQVAAADVDGDAPLDSDPSASTGVATASLLLDGSFAPLDGLDSSWLTAGAVPAVDPSNGAHMAASIQTELELQQKLEQIEQALNGQTNGTHEEEEEGVEVGEEQDQEEQ